MTETLKLDVRKEVIILFFFICIGNNQPKQDRRNEEHRERFRYVYPDRIELSFREQPNRHVQSYQREGTSSKDIL